MRNKMNKSIALRRRSSSTWNNNEFAFERLAVHLMVDGKRSIAEDIARSALAFIKIREEKESLAHFVRTIQRTRPLIDTSISSVGGRRSKTKIIPISPDKGQKYVIQ